MRNLLANLPTKTSELLTPKLKLELGEWKKKERKKLTQRTKEEFVRSHIAVIGGTYHNEHNQTDYVEECSESSFAKFAQFVRQQVHVH